MAAIVQLRLLGGFALARDGAAAPIASHRMQALLAYLALHRPAPQPRQRLAALLWPDSSEPQAFTNLRTLLHRLHAVLPDADRLIEFGPQVIAWRPTAAVECDVADFEAAARQADAAVQAGDEAAAIAALERAAEIYAGDLLPECYDEWVIPERERLHHLLLAALGRLVGLLEQRRAYVAAIPHARRLVQLDPLNEAAHLVLVRLHVVSGDRATALRAYHTCASLLQTELGVAPGAALAAAHEGLLAAEAPPANSLAAAHAVGPLVGRAREWQRLQASWQVAAAGQPRLLVLSGVAGIGKTRLAEELLRWAGRQGSVTAVTTCYAAEGDLAFAPVIGWLRADALRPGLARLPGEWLAEARRLAPDLGPARADLPAPRLLPEHWQRRRLFEALARAVGAVGRPTLLLIDDLQWCDRDTLEWLHFLLRFDPQARLLVVGTVRVEEVEPDHPLVGLLDALRQERRLVEIALDPLNRDETASLAAAVTGREVGREQADDLFAETEGNPLFVVETARAGLLPATMPAAPIIDRVAAALVSDPARLPPAVEAVIARRLNQATPPARALLAAAAVIGRSFTGGALARAAGVDEDALVRGLDELWRRRIVGDHGPDAYDFTHDKLRATMYAGLSPARRRLLHRRVAEALEVEHAADLDAVGGQLAAHYERAGLAARAALHYQRAAAFARRLPANAAAIDNYRRALALLGGQASADQAGLYDQLGEVLHIVGRYAEAREAWRHAIAATPGRERVARGHLHRKLGNAWRDQYEYDAAMRAYDEAEAALGCREGEAVDAWLCWGQIALERITTLYWLGRAADMARLVDQVRVVFERHGSPADRARYHQISSLALLRRDRYRASREIMEHVRAYRRAIEEADDVASLPAARFQVGFASLWADDLAVAEEEIGAALALAECRGDVSLEGRCLTYLTVIARRRGDVDRVRAYAERSQRVAAAGQMPDYLGAARGNLAWLAWRGGDQAAVLAHGRAALAAWRRLPAGYMFEWVARWPLLAVALADGELKTAIDQARSLLDERQQRPPAALEPALEAAVEAARAGDLPACRAALAASAEAARALGYL